MLSDLVYTTRHFRVCLLFILSSLFVTVASWPLTEILQEIVAHLGTLGIMKDKQVKSETVNTNWRKRRNVAQSDLNIRCS